MTQFPTAGGRYFRDKNGNLSKDAPVAVQPAVKSVAGLSPIGSGTPVDPPAADAASNTSADAQAADADATKKGK